MPTRNRTVASRTVRLLAVWFALQFLPAVGVQLPQYRGYNSRVNPTLTNEFRFGYNYGHYAGLHNNANNSTLAASLSVALENARLFEETRDKQCMRLLDTRTVGDGLAFLAYEVVREA